MVVAKALAEAWLVPVAYGDRGECQRKMLDEA
jgi:hypothetical protein